MNWQFDDYEVHTGYTNAGHVPIAYMKEFFALSATGSDHQEAIQNLRREFERRIRYLESEGMSIPDPGDPPEKARFAPNNEVEALRPFVDEFWSEVLGTPYAQSYVSNKSTLDAWEDYVGGRENLIARVREKYDVDISAVYDEPVPTVLRDIRARRLTSGSS